MKRILRWILLRLFPSHVTEDQHLGLVSEASLALMAGVRLTLRDWKSLSSPEQSAWSVAGDRHETLICVRSAMASMNPKALAIVSKPIDGGALEKALSDAEVSHAVKSSAARLSSVVRGAPA